MYNIHRLDQWDIVLLGNKNYILKNCEYLCYAHHPAFCQIRDDVYGGRTEQQWKIRETRTKGQYMYVRPLILFLLPPTQASPMQHLSNR
jgi:hypothetical protein